MKKTLLGVLALTSVASFANVNGYVKSNSEATVKSDDIQASQVEFKYGLSTKLDLGLYLDSNKDTFVFAGGELKGEGKPATLKTPGYLGVRYDGKVTENSSVALTGAYRIKDGNVKDQVKEHAGDANRDNGYSFNDGETILLSGVGYGKYDSINYRLGMLYNSENFAAETHRLESFVKADTKLEKVDVSAELTHKLGNFKTKAINSASEVKDDVKAFLLTGGNLKGEVKLTTDRLAKDLSLEHKAYFNLGTILPVEKANVVNVGLENKAVYKGVKGLELTGKLNYAAEVVSKFNDNGDQEGNIKHMPEAFVGVKYTGNKVMFSTENTDKVTVKHNFEAKPALIGTVDNFFKTNNKLEVKPVKELTLRAKALDILESTNLVPKQNENQNHINGFVGGLGLTATPMVGKVKFTHNLDVAYRLDNLNVSNLKNVVIDNHELFAWTTNKLEYAATDTVNLEANVDSYNYFLINHANPATLNEMYNNVVANGKVSYKHGRVDFSQVLGGRYTYVKKENRHLFGAESDSKLNYKVTPNVEINSGLNLDFRKGSIKEKDRSIKMFVESQGLKDDKFYSYDNYLPEVKFDDKKLSDRINEEQANLDVSKKLHLLVKPEIGVTAKFLDNKLTVKPAVSARVLFSGDVNDFKAAKFDTKGTLKVEYVW